MFVGTLSFEETGGLPERSDGETRAGGGGPHRSVWQPPGQAPPNVSRRGLDLGVTLLRGVGPRQRSRRARRARTAPVLILGRCAKNLRGVSRDRLASRHPARRSWPGVGLLLGGAPRQGPQGLWRQRARRPAVGLASTAGRWLASPTVSRWASHHPGPRPSCGFWAWGLGPAPCQDALAPVS